MKKIIRTKIDNYVRLVGDNVTLGAEGFYCDGLTGKQFNTSSAMVLSVDNVPDNWCGCWYTYINGEWSLTPEGESGSAVVQYDESSDVVVFTVEEAIKIAEVLLLKSRELGQTDDTDFSDTIVKKITKLETPEI